MLRRAFVCAALLTTVGCGTEASRPADTRTVGGEIAPAPPNPWTIVAGDNGGCSGLECINSPEEFTVDVDGQIFAADRGYHRITGWPPGASTGYLAAGSGSCDTSALEGPFILEEVCAPGSVAVDASGRLYVTDRWRHLVMRWEPGASSGTVVAGGNGRGSGSSQFDTPGPIAVASGPLPGAYIYVADQNGRVMRWMTGASDGEVAASSDGVGDLDQIYDVEVVGTTLYVAHRGDNRPRVSTFNAFALAPDAGTVAAGGSTAEAPTEDLSKLWIPWGIAIDSAGDIFIADVGNKRIVQWTPGASTATLFDKHRPCRLSRAKALCDARGLEIDAAEKLYAADWLDHRIARYDGLIGTPPWP